MRGRMDDEDEEASDDDDDDDDRASQSTGSAYDTTRVYKSANSFLHDLHAEHRHRAVFSSNFINAPPSSQQHPLRHAICPDPGPNCLTKATLPPLSERLRKSLQDELLHGSMFGEESLETKVAAMDMHEVMRVKEQYEDRNKCACSLKI